MKNYLAWSAAVVLAAGTLGGCGSSTEDYCNSFEDAQNEFSSLGSDFSEFGDVIDRLRDIGGGAPDEVSGDWDVLIDSFDGMEQSLEDAGLSFDDLGTLAAGEPPEGVDVEDMAAVTEAFTSLSSDEVTEASDNIFTHAEEECGITLE